MKRLEQFWFFFKDRNLHECRLLVEDFNNILNNNFDNLNYKNIQVQQTIDSGNKQKNYAKNLISSTNKMHEEGDRVRNKG